MRAYPRPEGNSGMFKSVSVALDKMRLAKLQALWRRRDEIPDDGWTELNLQLRKQASKTEAGATETPTPK